LHVCNTLLELQHHPLKNSVYERVMERNSNHSLSD